MPEREDFSNVVEEDELEDGFKVLKPMIAGVFLVGVILLVAGLIFRFIL